MAAKLDPPTLDMEVLRAACRRLKLPMFSDAFGRCFAVTAATLAKAEDKPELTDVMKTMPSAHYPVFKAVCEELGLDLVDVEQLTTYYSAEALRKVAAEQGLDYNEEPSPDGDLVISLTPRGQPKAAPKKRRPLRLDPVSVFEVLPGETLFDMHDYDWRRDQLGILEPHELIEHIEIDAPDGCAFIKGALREMGFDTGYTNKGLVVIGYPAEEPRGKSEPRVWYVRCAYSYDDRKFGLMKIAVTVKEPTDED